MKGFHDNIETLTAANRDFRRVLYTGKHLQLVLMTLAPGEEIGAEIHPDRDPSASRPARVLSRSTGSRMRSPTAAG